MQSFSLTEEQQVAVDLFATGESLAIEAGAGTGKTSTLVAIAKSTDRVGTYVAFNKAIVTDAAQKFPKTVTCTTAHSLAFRTVGVKFAHRLQGVRVRNDEIARRLGISPIVVSPDGQTQKVLQPGYLASVALQAATRFCQSADGEPAECHIPYIDGIDLPDDEGRRTFANNSAVRELLLPAVQAVWADWCDPKGQLRYSHDAYLKLWQLSDPVIPGDFVLFDEAQDANPVLIAAVSAQDKQVVWVGDSQQQIYSWRGAVNALAAVKGERCFLTHSFRFGPEIAAQANRVLEQIEGAELRIVGCGPAGSVARTEAPNCILARTNAGAISAVLGAQEAGQSVHLVGGGAEIQLFCEAARVLQEGRGTSHPDLACFDTWAEVLQYVQAGEGDDIKLLVNLIERYGVDAIIQAVSGSVPEHKADVVVSTAHRSKGREWDVVQLGGDFPPSLTEAGSEEKRLAYVAVTRARLQLDLSRCPMLNQ